MRKEHGFLASRRTIPLAHIFNSIPISGYLANDTDELLEVPATEPIIDGQRVHGYGNTACPPWGDACRQAPTDPVWPGFMGVGAVQWVRA
jgi:hypothetical protein